MSRVCLVVYQRSRYCLCLDSTEGVVLVGVIYFVELVAEHIFVLHFVD